MSRELSILWWEYAHEEKTHLVHERDYRLLMGVAPIEQCDLTLCNQSISMDRLLTAYYSEETEKPKCDLCKRVEIVLELGE